MHMQPKAVIPPNVASFYPREASHHQDLPRETPKADITSNFLEIQPNFKVLRKSWSKTARVPPIFVTFVRV